MSSSGLNGKSFWQSLFGTLFSSGTVTPSSPVKPVEVPQPKAEPPKPVDTQDTLGTTFAPKKSDTASFARDWARRHM